VLDFGSQYTQLIARRIRELNVFSVILPWDVSTEKIKSLNPKGVILSGGPESVTESNTPRIPEIIFELDVPVLRYLLWDANSCRAIWGASFFVKK
jgi:GMP synthase (glutamine-hydrolysing)